MSPVIELGVDFNKAQKEADALMQPAPAGVYQLQVSSIEAGVSKNSGRGRLMWLMQIVNSSDPSFNGKKVTYFTNIPTATDTTGIGFLVQITNALKKPWNGTTINTDDYLGQICKANIGISDDGKWNNIISFV